MKVGIIGLGAMGRAMAVRLASMGEEVHAFDIDPDAVERLGDEPVRCESSPRAVAQKCELVVSVVWDDTALRQVVLGPEGVLSASDFAGCLVDLSTTSVDIAETIGEAFAPGKGDFLDGAVIGGGVPAAVAGESPIIIAGDAAVCQRYLPILQKLGRCDYVGPQGTAKIVKVINNHLVGVISAANSEALSLGISSGINAATLFEVLREGNASSFALESYFGRYLTEGRYGEGLIGHDLMHKDVSLACQLAESLDRPAPFAGVAQQFYIACAQALGGLAPFPSSFDYLRRLAEQAAAKPEAVRSLV
jgi:3-hydroxyisobutyrate dehydrogenase-like beta-hydroxyacid dehydrogenase